MCKCARPRLMPPAPRTAALLSAPTSSHAAPINGHVVNKPLFEYVGTTALTVIGPASGRRYRFERPGARVIVDPRDRAALEAVPQLRALCDERRP